MAQREEVAAPAVVDPVDSVMDDYVHWAVEGGGNNFFILDRLYTNQPTPLQMFSRLLEISDPNESNPDRREVINSVRNNIRRELLKVNVIPVRSMGEALALVSLKGQGWTGSAMVLLKMEEIGVDVYLNIKEALEMAQIPFKLLVELGYDSVAPSAFQALAPGASAAVAHVSAPFPVTTTTPNDPVGLADFLSRVMLMTPTPESAPGPSAPADLESAAAAGGFPMLDADFFDDLPTFVEGASAEKEAKKPDKKD